MSFYYYIIYFLYSIVSRGSPDNGESRHNVHNTPTSWSARTLLPVCHHETKNLSPTLFNRFRVWSHSLTHSSLQMSKLFTLSLTVTPDTMWRKLISCLYRQSYWISDFIWDNSNRALWLVVFSRYISKLFQLNSLRS